MKTTAEPSRASDRIIAYDIARAFAVFGMVLVNFKIVMVLGSGPSGPPWLAWLTGLVEGRAAATFVVLAGVGLTLLSRRAREAGDLEALARCRTQLLKRALFLFVIGLLYMPIWPADILHFYGVYIAVGAFMLAASVRALWGLATAFAFAFMVLLVAFEYSTGWDWSTLTYSGFWTPAGFVRNLFFNGFHPVVPWTAFLLIGMWLGRCDLRDRAVRRRLLWGGLAVVVVIETLGWLLVRTFLARSGDANPEIIEAIFGTGMMPPTPLYLLAGGGVAVVVITLSASLAERAAGARWLWPLVATGQLALTLYVAHVVIGMGVLEAMGWLGGQTLTAAVVATVLFCVLSVLFACWWRKRFRRGPLEIVMRRLST